MEHTIERNKVVGTMILHLLGKTWWVIVNENAGVAEMQ